MKIAIISDIHCNAKALKNVLHFLNGHAVDHYFIMGDTFGYFPWAAETWEMVKPLLLRSSCILGNHDELIIRDHPPEPLPEYWPVIEDNRRHLAPEALAWLRSLTAERTVVLDNIRFRLVHGRPDNPLYGRYYPDNEETFDWFPAENEVLVMGHTHYPLRRNTISGGIMINPGSVGQPRDGVQTSSLCIFDSLNRTCTFHRVPYDVAETIRQLEEMNWYPRAIRALQKIK